MLLGVLALASAPFAGTYVPLDAYGRDQRVSSVMVEIRRDQLHPVFDDPDVLLASGLLPDQPWRSGGPDHRYADPDPRVVAFLSQVVADLTPGGAARRP